MELNSLTAISPLDGRYRQKVNDLDLYFSAFGLFKYRLIVEIEYFIALCEIPLPQLSDFGKENYVVLRSICEGFNIEDALAIKEKERVTNHDVKAVEYFIKEKFNQMGLSRWSEFIHFGKIYRCLQGHMDNQPLQQDWEKKLVYSFPDWTDN
jgi:adenylosuccinate lyase